MPGCIIRDLVTMIRRPILVGDDGLRHAIRQSLTNVKRTSCGRYIWLHLIEDTTDHWHVMRSTKPVTCLDCLASDTSPVRGFFEEVLDDED